MSNFQIIKINSKNLEELPRLLNRNKVLTIFVFSSDHDLTETIATGTVSAGKPDQRKSSVDKRGKLVAGTRGAKNTQIFWFVQNDTGENIFSNGKIENESAEKTLMIVCRCFLIKLCNANSVS